ncbi:MAG: chorismate--pyruvate lyase [Roseburia sp.]|nr:chorismate--pyruvate lyase [Ruminococcus sp.]MCM1155033.1 chorismate--pyruvate lyase [Roseburia sp.]MCM1241582.1 chorismate--pyruvate lyase [Roseburia sp.]
MQTIQYQVAGFDGDYANLRRIDDMSDDMKLVARALLPPDIVEGSRLLYEFLQYKMMD